MSWITDPVSIWIYFAGGLSIFWGVYGYNYALKNKEVEKGDKIGLAGAFVSEFTGSFAGWILLYIFIIRLQMPNMILGSFDIFLASVALLGISGFFYRIIESLTKWLEGQHCIKDGNNKPHVLFVVALLLLALGVSMCFLKQVPAATATYAVGGALAVMSLIFNLLGEFESFEGFGIKAKTRLVDKSTEQKREEVATDLRGDEGQQVAEGAQQLDVNANFNVDFLNWETRVLFVEERAVEHVAKDYGEKVLEVYKQKNISVKDYRFSVDGFLRLKEKDIFIEVKVSKTGRPPLSFLEDSMNTYLRRVQRYEQMTGRSAYLEFVLVGDFEGEVRQGIINRLRLDKAEGNFRFLSTRDVLGA